MFLVSCNGIETTGKAAPSQVINCVAGQIAVCALPASASDPSGSASPSPSASASASPSASASASPSASASASPSFTPFVYCVSREREITGSEDPAGEYTFIDVDEWNYPIFVRSYPETSYLSNYATYYIKFDIYDMNSPQWNIDDNQGPISQIEGLYHWSDGSEPGEIKVEPMETPGSCPSAFPFPSPSEDACVLPSPAHSTVPTTTSTSTATSTSTSQGTYNPYKQYNQPFEEYQEGNELNAFLKSRIWLKNPNLLSKPTSIPKGNFDMDKFRNEYVLRWETSNGIPIRVVYPVGSTAEFDIGAGHPMVNPNNANPTIASKSLFRKLFPELSPRGDPDRFWRQIRGGTALTLQQANKLINDDITTHIKRTKGLFPGFNCYPDYVQYALVDSVYRGDFKKTYKTTKYINSGNWPMVPWEHTNRKDYDLARGWDRINNKWKIDPNKEYKKDAAGNIIRDTQGNPIRNLLEDKLIRKLRGIKPRLDNNKAAMAIYAARSIGAISAEEETNLVRQMNTRRANRNYVDIVDLTYLRSIQPIP